MIGVEWKGFFFFNIATGCFRIIGISGYVPVILRCQAFHTDFTIWEIIEDEFMNH